MLQTVRELSQQLAAESEQQIRITTTTLVASLTSSTTAMVRQTTASIMSAVDELRSRVDNHIHMHPGRTLRWEFHDALSLLMLRATCKYHALSAPCPTYAWARPAVSPLRKHSCLNAAPLKKGCFPSVSGGLDGPS